jgi:T5orf172 domain-containing protein
MKSGYLYVLVHPSDPYLYKIGVTIKKPDQRLAEHNTIYTELTGRIVKETGQKWELKEYIAVPDPYWAEAVFWGATGIADMPGGATIEVQKMEWKWVQAGLEAVKKAGVRPGPRPRFGPVRNREWMINQLEGTGITMIGRYRGLVTGVEFQCEKGHVFKESAGLVANRKSCPCCVDWNWLSGPRRGLRKPIS